MAFSCGSILKAVAGWKVLIAIKHKDREQIAIKLGFEVINIVGENKSGVYIDKTISLLILACDMTGNSFVLDDSSSPLFIAMVARQNYLSVNGLRSHQKIDSFAYLPSEFKIAVDLIDRDALDLSYTKLSNEPPLSPIPSLALNQLEAFSRLYIKNIFERPSS